MFLTTALCLLAAACVDAGVITCSDGISAVDLSEIEAMPLRSSLPDNGRIFSDQRDHDSGLSGTGSYCSTLWSECHAPVPLIEMPITGLSCVADFSVPPDPELGGLIKPPRTREMESVSFLVC